MRWRVLVLLLIGALAWAACNDDGPRADEGRDASLLIEETGAQFYRRELNAEPDGTGPKVITASTPGTIQTNFTARQIVGELESHATAIAIGLEGDVGYWLLAAGIPLNSAPTSPTFAAMYRLAKNVVPGPKRFVFRAIDGSGHFGPATFRSFNALEVPPPSGRLVVSLAWNNGADLDLHVLLPTGVEIFKRNATEYERPPPSAGPVNPNGPFDGGFLDRDSNARCVFDGRRAENVIWQEAPPKGHYVVRVDTFSLCGVPTAYWNVEAKLEGVSVGRATGIATDNDVRFEHNRGGGVLALEFDVP
jgi:hypothetical protein